MCFQSRKDQMLLAGRGIKCMWNKNNHFLWAWQRKLQILSPFLFTSHPREIQSLKQSLSNFLVLSVVKQGF